MQSIQYWPIYYGFFWKKKIKISQKLNDTSKKSSQSLVGAQMRKRMQNFQPSILKFVEGNRV